MTMRSLKYLFGALALVVALAPAGASETGGQGIKGQIQRTADELAADWRKHDAKGIAAKYFTKDVTAIGEGGKEFIHNAAGLEATLVELFKMALSARLEVHTAKSLGPDAAYAWVIWHCNEAQAKDKFQVRSLYVFKLEAGRWKIAADSYTMGTIPE